MDALLTPIQIEKDLKTYEYWGDVHLEIKNPNELPGLPWKIIQRLLW